MWPPPVLLGCEGLWHPHLMPYGNTQVCLNKQLRMPVSLLIIISAQSVLGIYMDRAKLILRDPHRMLTCGWPLIGTVVECKFG